MEPDFLFRYYDLLLNPFPSFLFLFSIIVLTFILLFYRRDLQIWKKYLEARIKIYSFEKKHKRRLFIYNIYPENLSPKEIGMISSEKEYEVDNPQKIFAESCDGIHFAGVNSEGNSIDLCINQIEQNMATVWLYLKLSEGEVYQSTLTGDTRRAYIASENMFQACGLQIKCLAPFRKWRISFNGLLRKTNCNNEDDFVHVKFSFIWLAMSVIREQNFAHDSKDLAKAFARASCSVQQKHLEDFQKQQNRFEQWGQMLGTLDIGEKTSEINFWSARTRILDKPLWERCIFSRKLYIYMMNGIPIKIEYLSIKDMLKSLISGYSINPYGGVATISKYSFDIKNLKETSDKWQFSFVQGGKLNRLDISFSGDGLNLYVGPRLQRHTVIKLFKVNLNGEDNGFGILHFTRKTDGSLVPDVSDFQRPPVLLKDPGYFSSPKSVLKLNDEISKSSSISGGKGSSLALLTELAHVNQQFIVPKGLVITTQAFDDFMKSNGNVYNEIQRLNNISCKIIEGDLKYECEKCAKEFTNVQLPRNLKDEIRWNLCDLFNNPESIRFSVRSSACDEDSEDLSAAGQMLTILGIKGIDNIFKAILQCWASKFSFEAVQYSRQNGKQILSPMAVVVQEMIPSDFSGVMFTVDPVTGNPLHPYITANYGLGESVVSSLAEPDTIILKRHKDNSVGVSSKFIGSKKVQVIMGDSAGTEHKEATDEFSHLCLTNDWAIKIGNVGILIESCFCSPRDIEWAVFKDQLYLLQARPITTLHTETDFELTHDHDTPVFSNQEFWTRANTGEVFLGAISPLGISLIVSGMDVYGQRRHVLREGRGDSFCPYYLHVLCVTHRQVCLNLVDTIFRANEKDITAIQKAFEVALFGRRIDSDEIHQAGIKKYGYASAWKKYFFFLYLFVITMKFSKFMESVQKGMSNYNIPMDNFTTAKDTLDGILAQMNFYAEACNLHGISTLLSSYTNMMMMTILAKGKKEWDTDLYCDFAALLSSCPAVESADVPESMKKMAQSIAEHESTEFSSLTPNKAYDRLKSNGTLRIMLEEFLQKHGHRCVKEFDVYSKSWGMQPESLIPTLQSMVKSSVVLQDTTKEKLTNEEILDSLKTPLSKFNRTFLKFILTKCQKYVSQRERTKSLVIKTIDWLRNACYQLGDQMVREGTLPNSSLVFFLSLEEIIDIIYRQKSGLVPRAIRRKRLHPVLDNLKLPEITKGIPKPAKTEDVVDYSESFTLKGTPVCQGKVKGKAVVIVSLEEATKIQTGDILITHATDTGWSPYFPLLSGVVTVLGGLISHGAVVAREYGLPCVVGVQNATAAFKTGDTVILDGTKGTVTKISEDKEK